MRDGRAAIVSYYHYLRDVERIDVSLETVLEGRVYAGSWSEHFRAVASFSTRLLVRYEDLVATPSVVTERVSKFIGLAPSVEFDLSFEEMQRTLPHFFRSGRNDQGISELAPLINRYRELHSDVMQQLGYETV